MVVTYLEREEFDKNLDCCVLEYNTIEYNPANITERAIHKILYLEKQRTLEMQRISAIKLIIGGAAILPIILKSQKNEIRGKHAKNPFLNSSLRENLREYKTFPPKNIIEDLIPWATIRAMAPHIPIELKYSSPPITRPIWATEEYAIITFMSSWLIQINPMIADPLNATDRRRFNKPEGTSKGDSRISP